MRFASARAQRVLEVIADKWTVLTLYALAPGTRRFGELRATLTGISQKMLTQTLRKLEKYALIERKVHAVIPPMVEYTLTPAGRSLLVVLNGVGDWLDEYMRLVDTAPQGE